MIIEHNGKTVDTEREIRRRDDHHKARYVGTLKDGRHIIEWECDCWDVYSNHLAVQCFENVPVTNVRWFNVHPQLGWPTEEEAKRSCRHDDGFTAVRIEWQS